MKQIWQIGTAAMLLILLIALFATPASAASGVFWTKSYNLYQGQAVMHEIQVDCGAQLVLTSPYTGNFDLYAIRNYGNYGTCPSNEYIRSHYDKYATGNGGKAYLNLDKGLWCVLVYAKSGNGNYLLEATSNCYNPYPTYYPTPYPTYYPTYYPTPYPTYNPNPNPVLKPYKTDVKSGYLNQGQSKVQGYSIPSGRTYIEWILTGPCGTEIPITMMSANEVGAMRTSYCGNQFDLYIYKDCNPSNYRCSANYADTSRSSNSYVGVTNPQVGSIYYAQVYAKSGSGAYTLTCRSYTGQEPVVMMSKPEMSSMMYTATSVSAPVGSVF